MKLPAHFTVQEVLDKLELRVIKHQQELDQAQANLEEENKPKYKKTWFGYYKDITDYPNMFFDWTCANDVRYHKSALEATQSKITALKKLPLDAKVFLTVEEINELFSEE